MKAGARSIVVVGGGIAGGALGYSLASAGLDVTILERTTTYADRVRGEVMQAWGVADAQTLGVDAALLAAGGRLTPSWRQYNAWSSEPMPIQMDAAVAGVAGSLSIGHPVACQALIDAAAGAGAKVIRGVEGVEVTAGGSPTVAWQVGDQSFEAAPDLVIGADGRASTVRRNTGIEQERQAGISCIAGLLVEGLDEIPEGFEVTVNDDDLYMLLFRQTASRGRAYLCTGLSGKHRFAGPEGPQRFLEACEDLSYPWAEQLSAATPAGPCGTVVGDDAWAPTPFVDGVVLVGDAAGFGDPLLGQGLAMSIRDVRVVSDLILDGAATPAAFSSYGTDRLDRVTRYGLVADIMAVTGAEDCDNRQARVRKFGELLTGAGSPLFTLVWAAFAGPESIADADLDYSLPDQIRAAA